MLISHVRPAVTPSLSFAPAFVPPDSSFPQLEDARKATGSMIVPQVKGTLDFGLFELRHIHAHSFSSNSSERRLDLLCQGFESRCVELTGDDPLRPQAQVEQ